MPLGNVVSTVSDWVTGRDRNKEGRDKDREAQKEVNRQVEANYAFDLETYAADVFNFQKERQFSYETAVTNWEYGKKIQDFTYANDLGFLS